MKQAGAQLANGLANDASPAANARELSEGGWLTIPA